MEYTIYGTRMPMVEVMLDEGESVYAQSGVMRWMDEEIDMESRVKGGLISGLKRVFGPGDIFTVAYTARRAGARVAFGHTYPGNIYVFNTVEKGVICQKRGFLCATNKVTYENHIQEKLASNYGAEGFVMDKFYGQGLLFVEMDGECIERELGEEESIKVDPALIGACEETVSISIERFSKGFPSKLAGEGGSISLARLTGAGKVWLQSMPVQSMVGEISKYFMPSSGPR